MAAYAESMRALGGLYAVGLYAVGLYAVGLYASMVIFRPTPKARHQRV
jgi:hypothetical protein